MMTTGVGIHKTGQQFTLAPSPAAPTVLCRSNTDASFLMILYAKTYQKDFNVSASMIFY